MDWNHNATFKRWIVIGSAFVLIMALMVVCLGGGDAHAATLRPPIPKAPASLTVELPDGTTYTSVPEPVYVQMSTGGQWCWKWPFGPWEDRDGANKLRFGYGEDVVACYGQGGHWNALPQFDPYHYLGYWKHDSTKKGHSDFGYSWLDLHTTWSFSWVVPLTGIHLYRDRTLRCHLTVADHNANCTIYY